MREYVTLGGILVYSKIACETKDSFGYVCGAFISSGTSRALVRTEQTLILLSFTAKMRGISFKESRFKLKTAHVNRGHQNIYPILC